MIEELQNNSVNIDKTLIDIFNGYSKTYLNHHPLYIKHFNQFDQLLIDEVKNKKLNEALSRGLPLEIDKFRNLKSQNIWTRKDEDEIIEARMNKEGLEKSKKHALVMSQIKDIDAQIKEWADKLDNKLKYKNELLGMTAERFAERAAMNIYIRKSLFRDEKLLESYLEDVFDEIEDEELNNILISFNNGISHIDNLNIKKAALSVNFQNLYGINDNPYYFLGKFVVQLTFFQISLFSSGRYYKHIIEELGNEQVEQFRNDPEKIESLFISSQNKNRARQKHGATTEFFGDDMHVATNRDYKEAELLSTTGFSSIDAVNKLL